MKSRRRFELTLATLLLCACCLGSALAQDTQSEPNGYPQDGAPAQVAYPQNGAPGQQNYPQAGQQGYPQAGAPGQQNYPQNGAPGQPNTDPPGRVARVQYMNGEVSIQPGGVNDWVAANMNRPLTTSDRIWTDKDSKAELNVGGGYIRMNSETSVTLSNVNDNTVQLELDQGRLNLTVRHLEPGEIYEVDTPNTAFTVMKPGVYRFDVYPNEDQTWVTVRSGNGEATGRGSAVKVKSGEQVRFTGGNSLQHTAEAAPAPDGFDDWAQVRDKRLDSSESARYVSPGMVGYEDLDAYGRWQTLPQYGPVWVPTGVPVGWAPYRYGHWAYIAPWGWTWVDDAPWGFAPFHYGRWVSFGGYWGWAPGPYRYYRPCYAPALVAWVGGPGFGVGFGFGGGGFGIGVNFGWFPLGWGEPYYPWYGGRYGHGLSANYIRNVNVTNTRITNINNVTNNYYGNNINNTHYVNRNVNGAVTAASQSAIASGQPINRVGGAVPRNGMNNAQVVRNINATPTRSAVLGGAPRTNGVPASTAMTRPVVTHATPPAREARLNAPAAIGSPAASAAGSVHNPSGQVNGGNGAYNAGRQPASNSGAANGNTQSAREVQPNGAHNVPRPPSSYTYGSNANGNPAGNSNAARTNNTAAAAATPSAAANQTHNVPRPPQGGNQAYAHGSGTTANTAPYNGNAAHQQTQVNSAPSAPASHNAAPARESAPPAHSGSQGQPKSAPKSEPKGDNKGASVNVPRPPSSYSYQASPAYASNGNNRSSSGYSGTPSYSRSSGYSGSTASNRGYSAAQPYSASPAYSNRGYSAAPAYRSGGYNTTATYTARSAAPVSPRYSAPSQSYSRGPSSGGSAPHYSAPSGGGGSSHASHGSSGGHGR